MATTTPDNISYPTNASTKKPIEGHIEDTATSIQTALNTKAASSHSHATTDITSGTLGVARGGTGATTLTSGGYLKGAGTGAVTAQTGVPAADITSGALDFNRLPSGSVIQVGGVNTGTTLAGTFSGTVLTSFTFAPKLANSKLLLQSSAVVVGEYNNVDNEFYMAAYRDGNLVTLSRQTAGHFHFSGSLNVGWMSFNHYFTSWGTNSANIEIKVGNSSSMYANYPYYTNNYTGTAGFSIIEFMP